MGDTNSVLRLGLAAFGAWLAPAGYAAWGWAAGSLVGSQLFPAAGQNVQGPRLDDLSVRGTGPGQTIPTVWGTYPIRTRSLIWSVGKTEHKHEEDVGGKGGGGSAAQTTYTYTASFALAVCEGEIDGVRRIWADTELIYDARDSNFASIVDASLFDNYAGVVVQSSDSVSIGNNITIYNGTETQEPDPTIEAVEGAGNVPAHRGMAYIVFKDMLLEKFGRAIPRDFTVEVVRGGAASTLEKKLASFSPTMTGGAVRMTDADERGEIVIYEQQKTGSAVPVHVYSVYDGTLQTFDIQMPSSDWGIDGGIIYNPDDNQYAVGVDNFDALSFASSRILLFEPETWHQVGSITLDGYTRGDQLGKIAWNPHIREYMAITISGATGRRSLNFGGVHSGISSYASGKVIPIGTNEMGVHDTEDDEVQLWTFVRPFEDTDEKLPALVWATGITTTGNVTVLYDETTDCFVTHGGANTMNIKKIDRETGAVVWDDNYLSCGNNQPAKDLVLDGNGYAYTIAGDNTNSGCVKIAQFDLVNEQKILEYEYSFGGAEPARMVYQPQRDSLYVAAENEELWQVALNRWAEESVTLDEVVAELCDDSGMETEDYDVTALASTEVRGYARVQVQPARQALTPLRQHYRFDGVVSGYELAFRFRDGSSAAVTIPVEDQAAHRSGDAAPSARQITRTQEDELPTSVTVHYLDTNRDYEVSTQRSTRIRRDHENHRDVQLGLVATPDEAAQTAEVMFREPYVGRDSLRVMVTYAYLKYEPTDVIDVEDLDGRVVRARIVEQPFGVPGLMEMAMVSEGDVYTSNRTGDAGSTDVDDSVYDPGPVSVLLLDIPSLRDDDADHLGFYAVGSAADWRGAILYRSEDDSSYEAVGFIEQDATIGRTETTLGSVDSPWLWDRASTVTVAIRRGKTLSSSTESAVLASRTANAMLIGDEIIQFVTATDNGDGTYTLSTLLRGRVGTEWAIGAHSENEQAVLLESGAITDFNSRVTNLGSEVYFRAVMPGGNIVSAPTMTFTNSGVNLTPWSPTFVEGSRDGSDNLTITWLRRCRIYAPALWSPPLLDTPESYEVDIVDGGSVVRTITASSETATYTAADQTSDGLTPGDPVTVRIYQLNDTVGRGYKAEATI